MSLWPRRHHNKDLIRLSQSAELFFVSVTKEMCLYKQGAEIELVGMFFVHVGPVKKNFRKKSFLNVKQY